MPDVSTVVIFLIGVFEFISVATILLTHENESIQKHKVFPSYYFTDFKTKLLLCTYLMTLGFHRVSWATGNKSFGAWLCLVGTHAVEGILLWTLALLPTFNRDNLPVFEFIKQLVQGKITDPFNTFVLIFIPCLVTFLVLSGPPRRPKNKKN